MTEFENGALVEEGVNTVAPEAEVSDDAVNTEAVSEETSVEASSESVDWEKRCLSAEAALEDSLEFATMYVAAGGEPSALKDNAIYQRFTALRAMGLTVKEAFSAADSARAKPCAPMHSKDHLVSSHTRLKSDAIRLTGDEMTVARELLGDDYSSEEILKLYRRVLK